jgi:L-fuconolactonase
MLGSDWPVCTVAASYAKVMNLAYDYVSQFSIAEQADVCSGNAWRCYRLGR